MILLRNVKSRWHISIVLLALLVYRIIVLFLDDGKIKNPDAISAIERARSATCKKELSEFARRPISDIEYPQLKRSCKLDTGEQRVLKVGLATNSTPGLTPIEDVVYNSTICLDLCFSYGHSHGGYDTHEKICYCGYQDTLSANFQEGQSGVFDWYKVNNGIYDASLSSVPGVLISNQRKPIKLAFLLSLNGRNTIQVRRLLRNIYSKKHIYYIHIDRRNSILFDDLSPLEKEFDNIIVTRSRFSTIWGGPSLLRMILDAMQHLTPHGWDYLINLSESDLPIKPISKLEDFLGSYAKSIYLKSHKMKGYNFIRKQGLDRDFYQCENRAWKMGKRQLPRGIIYSGGSDWFVLPRDYCQYILDNLNNPKSLVKPLMQIYNYTLLPAESFFHTLALNSEFCDIYVDNNLRLTNWQRRQGCKCQHKDVVDWCGCSPLVYRSSDWDRLAQTSSVDYLFFSRKFDPTISSSIISAVERQLLSNESPGAIGDYDTRFWQVIYRSDNSSKASSLDYAMQQFGLFSLRQINKLDSQRLKYIITYFHLDRFVGHIYHFCSPEKCIELLVERRKEAHVSDHDGKCVDLNGSTLQVIEVNHGFDTGERMFREYRPLHLWSDVVVYHEWTVSADTTKGNKSLDKIRFSWVNPDGQVELIQKVKLKGTSKPSKLSLAHRLATQKPIGAGVWDLIVSHGDTHCLRYKFLVFDQSTFDESIISQEIFDQFYRVSRMCSASDFKDHDSSELDLCSESSWSSASSSAELQFSSWHV